eukprot:COSAG06_NODE_88_length_24864_cov_7.159368_6_plen_281_part_00
MRAGSLALLLVALAAVGVGLATADEEDDKSPEDILLDAILDGDDDKLAEALDEGADPNHVGAQGWTMLMRAAHMNRPSIIKALVDAGAKPNKRKKEGGAAILYAAEWGKLEAVRTLVENGANPDAASAVKANVQEGPQGQKQTSGGNTALHAACWSGNSDMVRLLVELGADITVVNADGQTPRDVLVKNGLTDLIQVLDPTDDVKPTDLTGCEQYDSCSACTDGGCAWCLSMPRTGKPACTLDRPRICSSKENHIGKANPDSDGCPAEDDEDDGGDKSEL